MKQTLNGIWNYRIGKGQWIFNKTVPYSALCVGHSECQRTFDLDYKADTVLLSFDGITYSGRVYLNGTFVAELLPYCQYTLDVTNIVKEKNNCLLVEIEDVDVPFGPSEGWENFGGIIRDVSIIYKNSTYIKDVHFLSSLTNNYTDGEYSVAVATTYPCLHRVTLSYGGKAVDTYLSTENESRVIKGVKPWSPDSPHLYSLKVELLEDGKVVDTHEERVGFCTLKCNRNRFELNGKDIFLRGVCRHEMLSRDGGHTSTYDEIYKDMKMIKDTGCNFVRLVHYPHNKVTLDIADELGLLVCEEPGMWQADVTNTELTRACLEVLKRTVIRDRNHPCIAFWLAFNECDFNEEFLKSAVSVCRENDPFRLVSGANNMPNDETKKYYTLCGLDFYTMHPYSDTFEMAREACRVLNDKPLMFTEWGGYYVYDNPHLLSDFLLSMHDLYKQHALAGTCLWYWAEINDYNRGGAACVDGVLKEALVDFDRKPNLIYHAFVSALKKMDSDNVDADKYEAHLHFPFDGIPLKCKDEPNLAALLEAARVPMKTRLAKTRKKQFSVGPILQKEEISGIHTVPFLLTDVPLVFEGGFVTRALSFLGMVSLNYGYPILGAYGEVAAKITFYYEDGETQCHEVKNGVDLTIAYSSVGSSRIDPVAENARRILSFSYDKNFESYVVNRLELPTEGKKISKVEIQSTNQNYNTLIFGVFFEE